MIYLFKQNVVKYFCLIILLSAVFILQLPSSPAAAVQISEATRTVPLDASGKTIVLTEKQLVNGQRKFNQNCAQCHLDGITKNNPDVSLEADVLAMATPPRNTVESLVDYLNNPLSYDGAESLDELHPSTVRTDLFPKMKNLSEADLVDVAGHILVQPKINGYRWGSGKSGR